MTDQPTGGILDGWDDELWFIDVHPNSEKEAAQRKADNLCIRPDTAGDMTCNQPLEHTGRCDWFAAALKLATRGGAA